MSRLHLTFPLIAALAMICLPDFALAKGQYTFEILDTSNLPLFLVPQPYEPHLNDRGQVAYRVGGYAVLGDELFGISSIDGQQLRGVIDSRAATLDLNNSGEIVFIANTAGGGSGLFTRDRFVAQVGITNGPRLNDAGQIAYDQGQRVLLDGSLVAGPGTVV